MSGYLQTPPVFHQASPSVSSIQKNGTRG